MDWESDTQVRYRRLDRETLQALVVIPDLGITFQLVYCAGDSWRVGEVSVADTPPFASFGGRSSISEAEREFEEGRAAKDGRDPNSQGRGNRLSRDDFDDDGDDDDDNDDNDDDDSYWGRYDATPARSPPAKQSPVPLSVQTSVNGAHRGASAEDAYYSQYDSVQPAIDPHEPNAEVEHVEAAPPLGLGSVSNAHENTEPAELNETNGTWTLAEPEKSPSNNGDEDRLVDLIHPRPASSASSNGSQMVARLEETAEKQEQNEFGVKQHVSRSIRSLYLLSRASGIDRQEFERLVRTELDVLGLMDEQE